MTVHRTVQRNLDRSAVNTEKTRMPVVARFERHFEAERIDVELLRNRQVIGRQDRNSQFHRNPPDLPAYRIGMYPYRNLTRPAVQWPPHRPYPMNMRMTLAVALAAVMTTGADTPALYKSGSIPTLSVMSVEVGGGEVLLEVTVGPTGAVTNIKALRETATFTERMVQAVKTWTFTPSEVEIPAARRKPGGPDTEAVETKILVAGVFRRPSVIGITLGEPIKDVAAASADVPYPTSLITPTYPP